MANLETQILDEVIAATRRKLLTFGGAALAGIAFAGESKPASAQAAASYSDNDILNFALNLEYLESNFYYLAAFGATIDAAQTQPDLDSAGNPVVDSTGKAVLTTLPAGVAGAPQITITGSGTQGVVLVKPSPQVPFTSVQVGSYATELAVTEGKHVGVLQQAINGGGGTSIAQPQIDLSPANWNNFAALAGIPTPFDPFLNETNFLIASYVFEDVGVTAYHGAAPLISNTVAGKQLLAVALGIHSVEAYHAGLLRTAINFTDPTGSLGLVGLTQQISALRSKLSLAAFTASKATGTFSIDSFGDDRPLTAGLTTPTVSLGGGEPVPATTIVNSDIETVQGFSRNTSQVINIVTAGAAAPAGAIVSPAKGGFFPNGLNGLFA